MNKHEDDYADLMEQLQGERPSAPEPNQQFSDHLRGQLLAKYDKRAGWGSGRLTGAATALAVLALVVFAGWYIASSQQPPTITGSGIEATRSAETADATEQLEVIHTTLRVSRVMDEAYTWKATIEHWQTADGQYTRTFITNEAGELLHFAQSDGTNLWLTEGINPITSPNHRALDFSQQLKNEFVMYGYDVPAFFGDVGWESNLGQSLVAADWNCASYQCVYEQLYEPPLGISPADHAAEAYGWGASWVGTEVENGRNVDILNINYTTHNAPSESNLPQYRQVKVDAETFAVLSITDFDGDAVLRHIEIMAQETMMMAVTDFKGIPSAAFATLPKRTPQTFAFGDGLQLLGYSVLPDQEGSGLQFTVFWQSTEEVSNSNLGGWAHIVNERNELVEDIFLGLQWEPSQDGLVSSQEWTSDLPNGRYQIYAGIYDLDTQENLLSDSGEDMVLLDTIVIEDADVVADEPIEKFSCATDFFLDGELAAMKGLSFGEKLQLEYHHYIQTTDAEATHTLKLYWQAQQEPTESLVAFVHVLDENGQLVQQQDDALAWMSNEYCKFYYPQMLSLDLPDGRYQVQVGLYDAASGQRVTTTQDTVEGETAVGVDEIVIGAEVDTVNPAWLETVRQDGRSANNDPLNVEAVVNYDITGLPKGNYELKLHYAHPEWEAASTGRVPIDGMSDWMPLNETQGSLTIHFTGNPQEMQSIVGTGEPVLVLMLATKDGGRLETYLVQTYDGFPLLLSDINEIIYGGIEDQSQ